MVSMQNSNKTVGYSKNEIDMFDPFKLIGKSLPDLTKKEIMYMYRWAEKEIKEYQKFEKTLEKELERREGK